MFSITAGRLQELGFIRKMSGIISEEPEHVDFSRGVVTISIYGNTCAVFVDDMMVDGVENETQLDILCRLVNPG